VVNPKWASAFLKRTGFAARWTPDQQVLRDAFHFTTDAPFAVALQDGRMAKALRVFDDTEPRATLKAMGWID